MRLAADMGSVRLAAEQGAVLVAALALTSINAAQVIDENSLTPTWGGERLDPTPLLLRLLPEPAQPQPAAPAA